LKESASRGGSTQIHESVQAGSELQVSLPRNQFKLVPDAKRTVLMAAGIGVTPLISMAHALAATQQDFLLHYCAKSKDKAAFADALLQGPLAGRVRMHFTQENGRRMDVTSVLAAEEQAHAYVCGPQSFIQSVQEAAAQLGWPESHVHWELFASDVVHLDSDAAFEVELARSGKAIKVGKNQTVADAIRLAGVQIPVSCEQGVCGTCLTPVVVGIPDHRDKFLTPRERAQNDQCKVSNQPVAKDRRRDTPTDTPPDEAPASCKVEEEGAR
jgi:vanillate monooxygenase ferredoxin subunit